MDNSERFLNLYRDLEEVLGVKYQTRSGAIQHFGAKEGARWQEELNLFREMRNLLSHHGKIEKEAPMQPSEPSIRILEEILEYAKHPPAALSIATLTDQLYCADGSELVTDLLEEMEQRGFSHIPVVDEKRRLTGVRDGVRAYEWPAIIRAINTVDVMTAEVPELDWELLKRMTDRITHEVPGICRVCYDLTPKPVGTVEWE